ncbi:MAG TPA: hypothetical protein VFZ59_08075 [Verrucomicrobiae bacterium]|nr:hypothetical protein [Verrucomicrobiae bacterium]
MMIRAQIRQAFLDLLKSRPHAVALLALLSVATTVPAKSQSEEFAWPNEAFNWHLSYLQSNRHPSLYVEVDAVEGAEPTENMLKMLDAFLRKHCDKPGGITIERSSVIPRKAARGYSADSLAAGYLEGPPVQTNRTPPAFLYILFYDSRVNANALQSPRDASQRPLRDPLPVEMSRRQDPHVNFIPEYPAMIYFDAVFVSDLLSPQELPEMTLLHEAGHTLGLVSREGRIKTAHCTNSLCLMQPTFRLRYFFIPWLKDKRPKAELCDKCDEELGQRRSLTATNRTRFVGPVLVRTTPAYSVFNLPGGFALYSGNLVDQEAWAFLKQFKERFASSRGKLERWSAYKVESDNDLPAVIQAALEDPSPDIRRLARHMQKAHNVKLPKRDTAKSVARDTGNKAN